MATPVGVAGPAGSSIGALQDGPADGARHHVAQPSSTVDGDAGQRIPQLRVGVVNASLDDATRRLQRRPARWLPPGLR